MKLFVAIVDSLQPLAIVTKSFILDVAGVLNPYLIYFVDLLTWTLLTLESAFLSYFEKYVFRKSSSNFLKTLGKNDYLGFLPASLLKA